MVDLNLGKLNRLSQANYGVDYNLGAKLASGINKDLNGISQELYLVDANGAASQLYALMGEFVLSNSGTGRLETPDSPTLSLTGDMDIRVGFKAAGTGLQLVAGHRTAGSIGWDLIVNAGAVQFRRSLDGTSFGATVTIAAASLPRPVTTRQAYRFTYNSTTGVATGEVGPTVAGPFTVLTNPTLATGPFFDSTGPISLAGVNTQTSLTGYLYRFQLRSAIGGTIVSDINFGSKSGSGPFADDVGAFNWTGAGSPAPSIAAL